MINSQICNNLKGSLYITNLLENNTNITKLNLNVNYIKNEGIIKIIVPSMTNSILKYLNLNRNYISYKEM